MKRTTYSKNAKQFFTLPCIYIILRLSIIFIHTSHDSMQHAARSMNLSIKEKQCNNMYSPIAKPFIQKPQVGADLLPQATNY